MTQNSQKKYIDEISMLKGIVITVVILIHVSYITGVIRSAEFNNVLSSISVPLMFLFYILSGYTRKVKDEGLGRTIFKRIHRILLPYYTYGLFFTIAVAIIYLVIEKRSLAWFADGLLGILFQLQSFHYFDTSVSGIHPMFYVVLEGWFLFQMAVSEVLFIPLVKYLESKKNILRLVVSLILFLLGAILYVLNLQGLNGEFFPTVCKIFILPNIPGITGLMMTGYYLKSVGLFDFDAYPAIKKVLAFVLGLSILIISVVTDDHLYDFPIGKWGVFGPYSYFISPLVGVANILFLGVICNVVKKVPFIKRYLVYMGDNSMDFLLMHFFTGFLTAYIFGYWHEFITDPVPTDNLPLNLLHFATLLVAIYAATITIITLKKKKKSA